MIDWTKPIEAVHVDGYVQPAKLRADEFFDGDYYLEDGVGDLGLCVFSPNGKSWAVEDYAWTIRNVGAVSSDSENDELAELRAFKEAALASGYVPAEPVDGDLLEASRLVQFTAGVWGMPFTKYLDEKKFKAPPVVAIAEALRAARGVDN